jgi:hypothetical protein
VIRPFEERDAPDVSAMVAALNAEEGHDSATAALRRSAGRALVAACAHHVREAWAGALLGWTALPKHAAGHAFDRLAESP